MFLLLQKILLQEPDTSAGWGGGGWDWGIGEYGNGRLREWGIAGMGNED
jgi:hypothetical protein